MKNKPFTVLVHPIAGQQSLLVNGLMLVKRIKLQITFLVRIHYPMEHPKESGYRCGVLILVPAVMNKELQVEYLMNGDGKNVF